MALVLTVAAILAVVVGLIHLTAKANVRSIKANPDPYPFNVLSREPSGEDVFIDRPDSTRLRARVNGNGPAIVFLHGYSGSLLEWNLIWQLLHNTGHRLVRVNK